MGGLSSFFSLSRISISKVSLCVVDKVGKNSEPIKFLILKFDGFWQVYKLKKYFMKEIQFLFHKGSHPSTGFFHFNIKFLSGISARSVTNNLPGFSVNNFCLAYAILFEIWQESNKIKAYFCILQLHINFFRQTSFLLLF